MKPSTVAELVGFALLAYAAWLLHPIAGYAVAGAACLLIGYATEDSAAALAIGRVVNPLRQRHAHRKLGRSQRRSERRARRKA